MLALQILEDLCDDRHMNANPVILGGLFPNGKCVDMWLPVLNR